MFGKAEIWRVLAHALGQKEKVNLELLRANQIRMATKRFAENGRENVEDLMPQRIWRFMRQLLEPKRTRSTDNLMKNILMHAIPECREQRTETALILDMKNRSRTKRRRAGAVYTNWDSLMTKWKDFNRWWASDKD